MAGASVGTVLSLGCVSFYCTLDSEGVGNLNSSSFSSVDEEELVASVEPSSSEI